MFALGVIVTNAIALIIFAVVITSTIPQTNADQTTMRLAPRPGVVLDGRIWREQTTCHVFRRLQSSVRFVGIDGFGRTLSEGG